MNCVDHIRPPDERQASFIASYCLVQNPNGAYVLERTDGLPIGPDERDILKEAARQAWIQQGDNALILEAQEIAKQARWLFPQSRRDLFGVSTGVYFITDETTRPGLVKIGYTVNNVLSRASQIRTQEGCRAPEVLAFASTRRYIRFESALHVMFKEYRVKGEWFVRDAVENAIKKYGGGEA